MKHNFVSRMFGLLSRGVAVVSAIAMLGKSFQDAIWLMGAAILLSLWSIGAKD